LTSVEWSATYQPITHYTLKMLGCFNPTLGQIWTNPNIGLKIVIKKFNPMAGFVHI